LRALVVGGLGGHSGQAFAIAYRLKEVGVEVEVLTLKGTEKRFEKIGLRVFACDQPIPPGKGVPSLRGTLSSLLTSLKLRKYDVVILNGSNFALLPGLLQKLKGAKVVNVEVIDAIVVPTRASKLAHKFADLTALHWEEQRRSYPRKSKVFGPIHEPPLYEPSDEGYVLVTAGSLGYKELFDKAVEVLGKEAVLQTGKVPPELYRGKVREAFSFSYDFHKWLAGASVVVGTFPGSTLAIAALAYGKPTVMVPNPELRRAAPKANMLPLAQKLGSIVSDLDSLKESVERARKVIPPKYPDGARKLAHFLLSSFL